MFGSAATNQSSGAVFGSTQQQPSSGGGLFGSSGGFGGLGAKPDPEKAKINPFGGTANSTTGNSGQTSSLFGGSKPSAFGSALQSPQSTSGAFSGGGNAFSGGFGSGSDQKNQSSSGFGGSAFGSTSPSGGGFGSNAFGASSPKGSFH